MKKEKVQVRSARKPLSTGDNGTAIMAAKFEPKNEIRSVDAFEGFKFKKHFLTTFKCF